MKLIKLICLSAILDLVNLIQNLSFTDTIYCTLDINNGNWIEWTEPGGDAICE